MVFVASLTAMLRMEFPLAPPESPSASVAGFWPHPDVVVALQVAPLKTDSRLGPLAVVVAT